MAKTNDKNGPGAGETKNNNGAGDGNQGGENNTGAGSGEQQPGETKTEPPAPVRPAQMLMPVVYIPGPGDEVCRHNGVTRCASVVTQTFGPLKANLQVIPDGPGMQWRSSVDHVSVALEGADAWCHYDEKEAELLPPVVDENK